MDWFAWLRPFLRTVSVLPAQADEPLQPIATHIAAATMAPTDLPVVSGPSAWRLEGLQSPDWDDLETASSIIAKDYKGHIGQLPPAQLNILLSSYEMLMAGADQARRKPQLELFYARTDANGNDRSAAHEKAEARYHDMADRLAFIKQELTALTNSQIAIHMAAPELTRYAPWLRYIREVERIDPPKELQARLAEQINQAKAIADAVTQANQMVADPESLKQQHVLMARAMDAAVGTHIELAKARGFKGEGTSRSPVLDYSMAQNQVSAETMAALEKAGSELIPAIANVYEKKAAIISPQGDKLTMSQLDGALPEQSGRVRLPPYTWEQGKRITHEFYTDLGLGPEVKAIFDEGRIDSRPLSMAPSKEPTPQVMPISGAKPYVLTLFDGSWESLSNLIHEVGHGIHYGLAEDSQKGSPNALYGMQYAMPVPLIETYALFGERLLFEKQLKAMKDEGMSAADIAQLKLDFIGNRMFFTSQAMGRHNFEKELHQMKLAGQTLTTDNISDAWVKHMAPCYGSHIDVTDPAFRTSWMAGDMQSYFTESPFYGYGYLYASQASDLLYEAYKANPEQFKQQWKAMQCEGQQKPMEVLLKEHFNIDLTKPQTLHSAVERTKQFVDELDLSSLSPTKWQDKMRPPIAQPPQLSMAM